VTIVEADDSLYAATIDGVVAMKLGPRSWSPSNCLPVPFSATSASKCHFDEVEPSSDLGWLLQLQHTRRAWSTGEVFSLQRQDPSKGQWALSCSGMEWAVWELRRGDGSGRAAAQPIPVNR
jgi:Alpha-amylase C-terminal beta-sheet domain